MIMLVKNSMKSGVMMTSKLLGLIVGTLMTVFLVGCGDEQQTKPAPREFSVYEHCINNGANRVTGAQYPELVKQCADAQVRVNESARIVNESKK